MLSLFVVLSISAVAQTAVTPAGDGSVGNPYQIATLENLYWISMNNGYWGLHFKQTANINASASSGWNGGAGFPMIGFVTVPFSGTYDGQGFYISNLVINKSTPSYSHSVGFIGYLSGTVKNLKLYNVMVTSTSQATGGLVGLNVGIILNCAVTGTVSGIDGALSVGGIVGHNSKSIDSCYSNVTVSGGHYVGGLVGTSNNTGYQIGNCYSVGSVNGSSYTGGLVGHATYGAIVNCFSTGAVTSSRTPYGGLLAFASSLTVTNSFWDTQTSGQPTSAAGTGMTTSAMKTQTTFTSAGWNFTAPWGMNSAINNGYPYIRSLASNTVVSSMSPIRNARNVSASSNINFTFSEPVASSTLMAGMSVLVYGSVSGKHSGSITYSAGTCTATFDPSSNFIAGELVSVTVNTQVKSSGLFPLSAPHVWTFTVASDTADQYLASHGYAAGDFPIDVISTDVDNDGDNDIVASNSTAHTISILKNSGNGTFAAKIDVSVGNSPRSIAAGDLDRNGTNDIVTANAGSNTISVLLNNGGGSYAAAVSYGAGSAANLLSIADLNGDGWLDIAATAYYDNTVSIYLNNGDGTFAARTTYTSGANTVAISSADVDGDSDLDLVIGNYEANTVSVLRNNGSGVFGSAETYGVGTNSIYLVTPDVDGDGDADIVVVNRSSNSVTVLKNNGSGTFGSAASYPTGAYPFAETAGDVDGDGDIDLVTTSQNSNTFSILKNDGTGNFSSKTDYAAPSGTLGVCVTDLDQDGDLDIITTNSDVDSVSVMLAAVTPTVTSVSPSANGFLASRASNISATFNTAMDAATFTSGTTVKVTGAQSGRHNGTIAFSGGGKTMTLDPTANFVAGERIEVTLTTGIATTDNIHLPARKYYVVTAPSAVADSFAARVNYPVGSEPRSVTSADVDADGDVDLISANGEDGNISVLLNNGNGTFAAKVNYSTGDSPNSVAAADMDADGDMDLVTANYASSNISVLLNNGNGTFAASVEYTAGDSPINIFLSDLDNDGDKDVLTANYGADSYSVLLNIGNGSFGSKTDYAAGSNPMSIVAADLDQDGDNDVAVANSSSQNLSVRLNNGNGTFASSVDYTIGNLPNSVAAADVDADGDMDLLTVNNTTNALAVLKNNGNGTFAAKVEYGTDMSGRSIAAVDIDGDGDQDVVAANNNGNTLSVVRNNGNGTFASNLNYPAGSAPISVTVTDLDGDGDVDCAVANNENGNLSVYLNSTYVALPVELVSFTAQTKSLGIELRWSTATEVNNHGFEVERRTIENGKLTPQTTRGAEQRAMDNWSKVGFVEGSGTSNAPKEYSYSDRNVGSGTYAYRLKQIDRDGKFEYSKEVEVTVASAPAKFELSQNYPNPFNPSTTIGFTLQRSGMTTLKVYDAIGREVATLVNEYREAGVYHHQTFDGSRLSSGVYFIRLQSNDKVHIRKMSLMK